MPVAMGCSCWQVCSFKLTATSLFHEGKLIGSIELLWNEFKIAFHPPGSHQPFPLSVDPDFGCYWAGMVNTVTWNALEKTKIYLSRRL